MIYVNLHDCSQKRTLDQKKFFYIFSTFIELS